MVVAMNNTINTLEALLERSQKSENFTAGSALREKELSTSLPELDSGVNRVHLSKGSGTMLGGAPRLP
jgi:hypothetical protein